MKKLLTAAAVSLVVIPSTLSIDGLYAGINLGVAHSNIELKRRLAIHRDDTSDLGQSAPAAGMILGYNYVIPETPLLIGVELNIQNNVTEISKEENTFPPFVHYKTTATTNNSFGGVFKLGIVIKDMIVYGKTGLSKSNWRLKFEDKSNINDITISNKTTNTYGYVFGGGIDYKLDPKWMIGVDHTISNHEVMNLSHDVGQFKFKPTVSTTSLRIIYTF